MTYWRPKEIHEKRKKKRLKSAPAKRQEDDAHPRYPRGDNEAAKEADGKNSCAYPVHTLLQYVHVGNSLQIDRGTNVELEARARGVSLDVSYNTDSMRSVASSEDHCANLDAGPAR